MTIENISISSVYATVGTCALTVAVMEWVLLEAVLGTVDFSKSSGPPADGVNVSRRGTCISAEGLNKPLIIPHFSLSSLTHHFTLQQYIIFVSHVAVGLNEPSHRWNHTTLKV